MSQQVLKFWFDELSPNDWYKKDPMLDREIRRRFLETYWQAARGELFSWRRSIEGRLAEIITLDQFSRNIFRDHPQAFQADGIALVLAQEASQLHEAEELEPKKRSFLYMPFMHSESLIIHEEAMLLFSQPGFENGLEFEMRHKCIIEKFGRYPHRNKILGRTSTPEELEFLKQPNSSF